jgi:hypothetical protein
MEAGDMSYMNYDRWQAVQTYDIIGKHIYEFKSKGKDEVPDIFILLVSYFEITPELYKSEGLFRVNGCSDLITELQNHVT